MFFQKEPKNLRIIILIIAACLVAGAALLIYSGKKPPPPKEEKIPAGIEVIDTETGKIVRNKAEGYEVTVPKEWEVPKTPLIDEKIIVQWIGPEQKSESELQDGFYLQVYIDENPENLSIIEWAKKYWTYPEEKLNLMKIDNLDVIKTIEKVTFGANEPNQIIIENSQITDFSFSLNKKIYTYSCTTRGSNYLRYTRECENVIVENIKKISK